MRYQRFVPLDPGFLVVGKTADMQDREDVAAVVGVLLYSGVNPMPELLH